MVFPEGLSIYASPESDLDPTVETEIKGMLRLKDPSGENTAAIAMIGRLFRLPHKTLADQLEFIETYVQVDRLINPRIR